MPGLFVWVASSKTNAGVPRLRRFAASLGMTASVVALIVRAEARTYLRGKTNTEILELRSRMTRCGEGG
jgi:hypothetical protein